MTSNKDEELHIVTGAFGYSGKYIARRLIAEDKFVRTLTSQKSPPPDCGITNEQIEIVPFRYDSQTELIDSLRGASVLYNTYWVRFSHGKATFNLAIENTKKLISAAVHAGVKRMVHVSISNPSIDSPFPYFSGKAELEKVLVDSGMSHAIIRPTVIFGDEDILINNIAWLIRRFPFFAIPGDGNYKIQPVFVDNVAEIAIAAGKQKNENLIIDAVGPETFTFNEMINLINEVTGSNTWITHAPAGLALLVSKIIGLLVRDVLLTRDELGSLMANLLISAGPVTGKTRLSDWLKENSKTVGGVYSSEIGRHYK